MSQDAPDDKVMVTWTVYDHPTDFPNCYAARKFLIRRDAPPEPTPEVMVCVHLDLIREELLKRGFVCLMRDDTDPPKIIETWI